MNHRYAAALMSLASVFAMAMLLSADNPTPQTGSDTAPVELAESGHGCPDRIDMDGDGVCDSQDTCPKHNGGGCEKHEIEKAGAEPAPPKSSGCGGCPRAQANGGTCGGH